MSQRTKAIVADSRKVVADTLPLLTEGLFEQLDDALYQLAEKSGGDAMQTSYFQTMRELRKVKDAIATRFVSRILKDFDRFWSPSRSGPSPTGGDLSDSSSLELIEEDQLEESLAISNIISKAESRFHRELFALNHRFGHLRDGEEISSGDNPVGPAALSTTFEAAIAVLETDTPMKLVIYKLFDRHVISYIGALYDDLNDVLCEAGVLPKLNPAIKRNPVAPAIKKRRRMDSTGDDDAEDVEFGEIDEVQARLYTSLTELLAAQRSTASAPPPGVSVRQVDQRELLSALNAVQQSVAAGNLLRSPEEVKAQLGEKLGLDARVVGEHSLGRSEADTLDVISMLFDFLVEDRNLPDAMKVLLGRLQIPMLKAAILDRSFFSKRHHPARLLLNELAQAAVGWSDEDERGPETLYGRIEAAVTRITDEFDTDVRLFSEVRKEFKSFYQREARGAELVEKRVCQANEGKEQLAQARKVVNALLRDKLISRDSVPVVARNLLRDAWKDAMVLTYLRSGPESEKWETMVGLVDQLLWSVEPRHAPEERRQLLDTIPGLLKGLREGLKEISFDQHKITQMFKALQECHVACLKAEPVKTLSVEEVRSEVVDVDTLDPGEAVEVDEDAMRQAEGLDVGTWVEYTDEHGETQRLKLSWKSRVSNSCLFVNRKGIKALELDLPELAGVFAEGRIKVLEDAGKPLMDRAMNAMLSSLKKKTAH